MDKDIYFFDDNQKLIKIVGEDKLFSVVQEKEITPSKDELINDKLSVSTEFDEEIKEAVYMAVREDESSFSMYKIIGTADPGSLLIFTGINFGPDELDAYIINDIRPANEFFQKTIQRVMDFTLGEWRVGHLDSTLPAVSMTFYYCSIREALKNLQTLGCEIVFKCNLSGEGITDKWVEVYKQIGEYSNERYEYGDKALTIEKEVDRSNIYTSLIGRGRGEEVGDGYGRRIEFNQVYWSKSKGDPLNKPTGQINLEIPEMTAKYGIPTKNGKRRKREKVVIFEDCEEPTELIQLTYQELVNCSRPLVQFKSTIFGSDKLGNIVRIHRDDRGYHYETRIFSVKIDRLTGKVETGLGDNLNTSSTRQASNTQNAIQTLDDKKMTFYESTEVSKWQSDIIRGAKGGSIIMMNPWDTGKGTSRQPYQMVWMNGDSIDTSNHFLVANSEGIGFIDGKFNEANFKTAWTIDGNFNANYIQSGRIRADIFETSFNAVGDQLKLAKGALQAVNNNKKIMELTKKGMEFWSQNGEIGTIGTTDTVGNPFPDASTPTPIEDNALVIRNNGKGKYIIISPAEKKGLVMLGNGLSLHYGDLTVNGKLRVFGDLEVQGKITIKGQEVFPGQGGGGNNGGGSWNGMYPPEVTSQADKFAWELWTILLSKGYSKAAVAGILGNVQGEAGVSMNPDIAQIGGPAYGIVQWDGSAYPLVGAPTYNGREYVQRLMAAAGITEDYKTMAAQGKLLDWTMYNGQWLGQVQPTTQSGFKTISDPSQAAFAFEKNYERPAATHPERQGWAVEWYNKFKDLKISSGAGDILSTAKSLLGYFHYSMPLRTQFGTVENPDRNGYADCSSFVWLALTKAGYKTPPGVGWYTGSMTADARGARNWLTEIPQNQGKAGDVLIVNQGGGAGANGHTAILAEDWHGYTTSIVEMGGMQSGGVGIGRVDMSFGWLLNGGDVCIARAKR
ncbi:phage tail spike protein [Enterococcus dongliensis]|uniref:Phage tail spike protein n=1 Tax=Enterococcus dongliensis TaxID=2559925 RepID=A0ABU3EV31_9ENTE|nr:phage tail spike protein [Enterococcus dongliensis]MDT2597841.1 phage tail spike protein [Enterococcus dongliensis]MDT2646454.1 phage tail spike protein [Enterococcus dongliensis]